MTNVTRIFDTRSEADAVISGLLAEGFTKDDISLLISDTSKDNFFSNKAPTSKIANDSMQGATIGGVLGGIIAGMTAVGVMVIPGINLLATGPIAAVLAGLGTGGVIGGLGAAINAELESEKSLYDDAIKKGKAVLIVHADTETKEARARSVLNAYPTATYRVA